MENLEVLLEKVGLKIDRWVLFCILESVQSAIGVVCL